MTEPRPSRLIYHCKPRLLLQRGRPLSDIRFLSGIRPFFVTPLMIWLRREQSKYDDHLIALFRPASEWDYRSARMHDTGP